MENHEDFIQLLSNKKKFKVLTNVYVTVYTSLALHKWEKNTLEKIANFLHEIIVGMLLGLRALPFSKNESLKLPFWQLLWALQDSCGTAKILFVWLFPLPVMCASGEAAAPFKSSVSLGKSSVLLNFIDFFHL